MALLDMQAMEPTRGGGRGGGGGGGGSDLSCCSATASLSVTLCL